MFGHMWIKVSPVAVSRNERNNLLIHAIVVLYYHLRDIRASKPGIEKVLKSLGLKVYFVMLTS